GKRFEHRDAEGFGAGRERCKAIETALSLRGIARVSLNGEILVEPSKPMVEFGGVQVSPPPGGFTQATKPAEEAMAELVT
ncbi:hypothetical protein ACC763_41190, partial [Rhizobium ruizarguesonis]